MAGKIGGNDDEPIAEINVVPLVDIILVVLIIFMVTAPMVLTPVIDVNLPNASVSDKTPDKPVVVSVAPDGTLYLNNARSTMEDIAAFATDLAKNQPQSAVIVAADQATTMQVVAKVFSTVKSAGIQRISFAIQQEAAAK